MRLLQVISVLGLAVAALFLFRRRLLASSLAAFALLLFAAAVGWTLLAPFITPSPPAGPYPVGTQTLYLQDQNRTEDAGPPPHLKRELIVQLWYPAAPSSQPFATYQTFADTTLATKYRSLLRTASRSNAPPATMGAPFHVLLYNHGWADRRTDATYLTQELASQGYVVAAIDHTWNAARVSLPGNRIAQGVTGDPLDKSIHTADEIRATWAKELSKWIADDIFVLNQLASFNREANSSWHNRLDTDRAGALGHSFGGGVSVALCSTDPRIRSAANMDGWSFGNILDRAAAQPVMFLYQDGSRPHPVDLTSPDRMDREAAELGVPDMRQVESGLKQFGGYRLFISHAAHMDFTDRSIVSPWHRARGDHIAPIHMQTIVQAYLLAFFDETLRGRHPPLLHSSVVSPFQEVQFESFTPAPIQGAAH